MLFLIPSHTISWSKLLFFNIFRFLSFHVAHIVNLSTMARARLRTGLEYMSCIQIRMVSILLLMSQSILTNNTSTCNPFSLHILRGVEEMFQCLSLISAQGANQGPSEESFCQLVLGQYSSSTHQPDEVGHLRPTLPSPNISSIFNVDSPSPILLLTCKFP